MFQIASAVSFLFLPPRPWCRILKISVYFWLRMVDVANPPEKWHVELRSSVVSQPQKYWCVLLKTHSHKQTPWTHPQSHWLGFPAENKASKLLPPLNPPLTTERKLNKNSNQLWQGSLCCPPWCWMPGCWKVPGLNSAATSRSRAWERGFPGVSLFIDISLWKIDCFFTAIWIRAEPSFPSPRPRRVWTI